MHTRARIYIDVHASLLSLFRSRHIHLFSACTSVFDVSYIFAEESPRPTEATVHDLCYKLEKSVDWKSEDAAAMKPGGGGSETTRELKCSVCGTSSAMVPFAARERALQPPTCSICTGDILRCLRCGDAKPVRHHISRTHFSHISRTHVSHHEWPCWASLACGVGFQLVAQLVAWPAPSSCSQRAVGEQSIFILPPLFVNDPNLEQLHTSRWARSLRHSVQSCPARRRVLYALQRPI